MLARKRRRFIGSYRFWYTVQQNVLFEEDYRRFLSVDLQRLADGHLLYWSIESKTSKLRFSSVIGPTKSNWISLIGEFTGGKHSCSFLGILGFRVLPEFTRSVAVALSSNRF